MKKTLSLSLLFCMSLLFSGCVGEEKDLFDSTAAERLQQTQKKYTEYLEGTTWAMEYYPIVSYTAPKGLGYLMLVRFNDNGTVNIGMKNSVSGNQYVEDTSLWEVITDQGMVLSFNSHNNVLHTFSDPGLLSTGTGYEGDYEFVMVNVPEDGDYVMLKGKKRGTYIRLTRLPYDTDFETYLTDLEQFKNRCFGSTFPNFAQLNMGEYHYYMKSVSSGMPETYPVGGDAITETTVHPYLLTQKDGKYYFRFRETYIMSDEVQQQEFVYDEEADVFRGTENAEYTISGEDAGGFFLRKMVENGQSWTMTASSSMSNKMKTYITELSTQYATKRFTFNNIVFLYDSSEETFKCKIVYRAATAPRNRTDIFNFTGTQDDATHVTLGYVGPANAAAETNYEQFSALVDLMNLLSQQFVVSPEGGNNFNMNKVRLTSVLDPDIWFVL